MAFPPFSVSIESLCVIWRQNKPSEIHVRGRNRQRVLFEYKKKNSFCEAATISAIFNSSYFFAWVGYWVTATISCTGNLSFETFYYFFYKKDIGIPLGVFVEYF